MVEGKYKLKTDLDFSRRNGGKVYEDVAVDAMSEMQKTRKENGRDLLCSMKSSCCVLQCIIQACKWY